MSADKRRERLILCALGLIPVIWLALLTAPAVSGGLFEIIRNLSSALDKPFSITWCRDSLKTVVIYSLIYIMVIGVYCSSKRNYRRREEHGSAKWGDSRTVCRKYRDSDSRANKILTQNVCIGLNGRKHRRNLNTLVIGGSGAGKTRFYAKPNVMQANTSYIICDPNGYTIDRTIIYHA